MNVLITGGTGSLGKTLIKEFVNDNDVYFTYYKNEEEAIMLEKKYNAKKLTIEEVSDYNYDIIINNAGISGDIVPFEKISLENFNKVFEINVTIPFKIIRDNLEYMKENNHGRIINVSSIYALKAEVDLGAFNTSKSALIGLTRSVTKEYAKYNITANVVLPGTFESDVSNKFADIYANDEEAKKEYYEWMTESIPAGRLGTTKEIASLIKFLSSQDASYINGAIIPIDGGYSA